MKVTNSLTMNGSFEATDNIKNSTFLRTKLKVFALGENNNGSAFSMESFERAKQSMKLIPVVAKYTDNQDTYGNDGDLTGHNVSVREKNGKVEFHYDTYPIGVIANTSNFTIEEVNEGSEKAPNIKQYIVADEVYLWKRYEATQKIEEWLTQGISPKISMEITNVSGQLNSDNYFQIEDFEFESVAALGSSVMPCFPRAEITTYSKQEFKEELKEIIFELNKLLQDKEGGNEMTKENEDLQQENLQHSITEEALQVDTDVKEEVEASTEDVKTEDEATQEFTENEESEGPTEDSTENTDVEDEPTVDYEAKLKETQEKLDKLELDYSNLQTQFEELKSYKRQREESDLKAKFEGKLSEDELAQVFTQLVDSELVEIEEKLYALIGKKDFSLNFEQQSQVNKVNIVTPEENIKPFGGFFG